LRPICSRSFSMQGRSLANQSLDGVDSYFINLHVDASEMNGQRVAECSSYRLAFEISGWPSVLVDSKAGRPGWLAQMGFPCEFGERNCTSGQLEKGVKWDLCFNSRLGPSIEC